MKKILIVVTVASVLLWPPLADAGSKKTKAKYDTTWAYQKSTKTWKITNKKRLSTLELIEKLNRKARTMKLHYGINPLN